MTSNTNYKTKYRKFKQRIYEIIGPTKKGDIASTIFDILICIAIIASSIAVIIELIGVNDNIASYLLHFEYWCIGLFIIEYLLRLWTSDIEFPECENILQAMKEFIISFESLIDIISILSILFNQIPKDLSFLRLLKLTKLVRLVKMSDYIENSLPEDKKITKFQKRIYEIISKDTSGDKLSKAYDIISVILILISVSFLITDTFTLSETIHNILVTAEIVIACLFAFEFIVRVWVAPLEYPELRIDKARMKYIFSFMAIIDLLSIIPVFFVNLPNMTGILKLFKLCKILRLVKASRYVSGIAAFGEAIVVKKKQILFSFFSLIILIVLCSLLMYSFEHEAQPDIFTNGFSGVKYGFFSMAKIDNINMEPITSIGKILSTVMSLLGACIFGVPVAIIADGFSTMITKQAGDDEKDNLKDLLSLYNSLSDQDKENFNSLISKNHISN